MNDSSRRADIVIVGGGIAGLSLAAALAAQADVLVLEREGEVATHSSARSARQMQPSYGPPHIRKLTARSIDLIRLLEEAIGKEILKSRPLGWVARDSGMDALEHFCREVPSLRRVEAERLAELLPLAVPTFYRGGAVDDHAFEVEVDVLVEHYRRTAIEQGVQILTSSPVIKGKERSGTWFLETPDGTWNARVVVDAAGAWADEVAAACGIRTRGLQPYRRTVVVTTANLDEDFQVAPMISDVEGNFYARPHGSRLLLSPSEEEPMAPSDVRPLDGLVESLLKRAEERLRVEVGEVEQSWAGLRSFSPEGTPLVGWDQNIPGFFWLAGHGGYGIQTSPALAVDAATAILQEVGKKTL